MIRVLRDPRGVHPSHRAALFCTPSPGCPALRCRSCADPLRSRSSSRATVNRLSGGLFDSPALLSSTAIRGFLRPIVAVLAVVFHVLIWRSSSIDCAGLSVMAARDALAQAMLGPGTHSIDACRFGRRVIVPPPPRD